MLEGARWQLLQYRRFVVRGICRKLYLDLHPDESRNVLLAGCGRSGTTWLAEIIAARLSARIMFEPFESRRIKRLRKLHYFHYLRPDDACPTLSAYGRDVFSGRIRDPWVDKSVNRLLPRFRVIKEIRANLFLKWLHLQFPRIPFLFMLRHPCAVVLSRMELGWATDSDIEPFLVQPKLTEDHLANFAERMAKARTIEEKHAIVWCVSNLIPFRQFSGDALPVVFYEDLHVQPEQTIAAVYRAIGQTPGISGEVRAATPSSTTRRSSAIVQGGDALRRWSEKLTREQVRNILDTVDSFGLAGLYGGEVVPLAERNLEEGLPTIRGLNVPAAS